MEWKYRKNVTTDLKPFTFVYSCITETTEGRIIDLYESYKAELSTVDYDIEELMVKEKNHLSFFKRLHSKYRNVTEK